MTWTLFSCAIAAYILWGLLSQILSLVFLLEKDKKANSKSEYDGSPKMLYIIIPLLREQARIAGLLERFAPILAKHKNIFLVLVTTERENLERNTNVNNTSQIIQEYIIRNSSNQIIHYHFPFYNRVVAEQLNFAVSQLSLKHHSQNSEGIFLAFYNADSRICAETIDKILNTAIDRTVIQQSSLFTSNIKKLFRDSNYFAATSGVYQSIWTLKHELPRLFFTNNHFHLLGELVRKHMLNYCVTHGLVMPLNIFNKVGGFPILPFGGEDLAIGYLLRSQNIKIQPFPMLENSDTPESFQSLWIQLSNWFMAVLGYFDFHKVLWKNHLPYDRKKIILLNLQGYYDIVCWLLKCWIIISYCVISYFAGRLIPGLMIITVGIYVPLELFFLINSKLSSELFPKFSVKECLLVHIYYPLISLFKSWPAIHGLILFIRIKSGKQFIKSKTE